MAWIESHTVLRNHRKVMLLARGLQIMTAQAVGHLHLLWHAAIEQQEDGDLTNWPDELIAELAGYPGDATKFVALLAEIGWLDGKKLHDWWEYAGRYLTSKYRIANPTKLSKIKKNCSRSKDGLKTVKSRSHNIHNIHDLPNIPKDNALSRKHSFEQSPFFEYVKFKDALKDWPEEKVRHYYEQAKGYSGANGGKYLNWILAVQNWDRKNKGGTYAGASRNYNQGDNTAGKIDTDKYRQAGFDE